jgi:hypothetical protein
MKAFVHVLQGGGALVLALALFGCGAPQAPSASPTAIDTASVQSRLTAGVWRLVDYRPEVPLELMLQALLAQQLRTMIVRFDGQMLSAQSPTLQIARPYTLENVAGLAFDLVSPDQQGAGVLRSRCEMSADGRRVAFRAQTDPWTGMGVLEREAP